MAYPLPSSTDLVRTESAQRGINTQGRKRCIGGIKGVGAVVIGREGISNVLDHVQSKVQDTNVEFWQRRRAKEKVVHR
jgi:hypothetical protein